MRQIITYAEDMDTGLVISRVGSELAWPILQYQEMAPENSFAPSYELEKIALMAVAREWSRLRWTREIPSSIKNLHREFWGMKPLRDEVSS